MISFLLATLPLCPLPHDPVALPGRAHAARAFEGLRTEFIPVEARLVLHFDLQGLQRTQIWKELTGPNGFVNLQDEAGELRELQQQFGIDLLVDIQSVTLWSSKEELEPEAAILTTTARIDQALTVLRAQPGFRSELRDGIELQHLVSQAQAGEGGMRVAVLSHSDGVTAYVHELASGQRAIVLGETPERVVRAAKVVRGETPNLAGARNAAFQARPRPGSFFFGATVGGLPKASDFQPASQILGLAQGIQFDLGEAGGSFFLHAAISTADVEFARKVKDSAAGLLAMGQLLLGAQEEVPQGVRDLLGAIQVTQSDRIVDVDFQYATSGLIDLIRTLRALDEGPSADDEGDPK